MKFIKYLAVIAIAVTYSCKSKKVYKRPLLKDVNKSNLVITKSEADEIHKYFSFEIPEYWNRYVGSHGNIFYSPLGMNFKKGETLKEMSDSVFQKQKAQDIFKFNKNNKKKRGYYLDCYIMTNSYHKDSIKVYNKEEAINYYLNFKRKQYKLADFKYEMIETQDSKLGSILLFKYGLYRNFTNCTDTDAIVFGDKRVYFVNYHSANLYYSLYLDDVKKIIRSLEIKQ
ncbi:hypothetical protein EV195_10466 [Tenacibaculum skagerrakense]|uniref:Uncharacterized protein n=1 Tax=Tenacibaculum skagerrakense TaxID=186571 RepID=A0A4R2NUH9_9FLAO|nr:hypothetical protein [Tenacibaculum skagerrakense]TCP25035.1 hypothetical protein EV195_10466 [Tenacibaculum skagerrakense]